MAEFLPAVEIVLRHEGGYCNHERDPGGATNFGISERFLEKKFGRNVGADEIRALTKEQAIEIYRTDFWLPNYSLIESQLVATKIFDLAVNSGHDRTHQLAQRALNDLGEDLAVDGKLGPLTLAAINARSPQTILEALIIRQLQFYRGLVTSDPHKQIFLDGWIQRARWPIGG